MKSRSGFTQHHFSKRGGVEKDSSSTSFYKSKSGAGFTLVELLLYVAIFAVVGGLLTNILITSVRTQNRESASNEVASELDFVLSTTQRLVRDSSLIDFVYEGTSTSTPCSSYCTLRLRMEDSALEPTIVRSDANGVYLKQGSGEETQLTTDRIIVNSFIFNKLNVAGGHSAVEIDASFTFNTSNPQLIVTKTLQSAISKVTAATFDSDLIPNADNSWNIGQTATRWRDLKLGNNLTVGGNAGIGTAASIIDLVIGDNDTGINQDGDGVLELFTNGQDRLHITNVGYIGIGTSTPDSRLVVYEGNPVLNLQNTDSGAGSGGVLRFGHSQSGSNLTVAELRAELTDGGGAGSRAGDLSFWTSNAGALSEQMRILDTGQVGIGTTGPTSLLHVSGGTTSGDWPLSVNEKVKVRGDGVLNWGGSADYGLLSWDTGIAYIGGLTGKALGLYSNGVEKVRIDTSGNVGIGTNGPSANLDVDAGTGRGIIEVDGSNGGCLKIRDTDDAGFTYCTVLDGAISCSTNAC